MQWPIRVLTSESHLELSDCAVDSAGVGCAVEYRLRLERPSNGALDWAGLAATVLSTGALRAIIFRR